MEWKKAMEGEKTPDSRENCLSCGVCNEPNISPVLFDNRQPLKEKAAPTPKGSSNEIKRYRLKFTKLEKPQYLSHLELAKLFIRAFRRAGVDLVYSGGYHPMPKVSFALALPVGTGSLAEILDIQVKDIQNTSQTIARLNTELPSGIRVLSMKEVPTNAPPPRIKESYFHIKTNGSFNKGNLDRFLRLNAYPVIKKHRNGDRTVDIRSQVKELNLLSKEKMELVLRHGIGPEMKPAGIIKAVFDLTDNQIEGMRILKTKCILT
jgi:radical SAM-linked protein